MLQNPKAVRFYASLAEQAGPAAVLIARDLAHWVTALHAPPDYGKAEKLCLRPVIHTAGVRGRMIGFPKPFLVWPDGTVEIDLKKLALQRPGFPRDDYIRRLEAAGVDTPNTNRASIRFPIARLEAEPRLQAFKEAVEWFIKRLSDTERIR